MKRNNLNKAITALMLAICTLFTTLPASFAEWDGYKGEEEDNTTATIVDMNMVSNIIGTGAVPSSDIKGSANYSAKWTNQAVNGRLNFNKIPRDWTSFEQINIPIYSTENLASQILFIVWSDYVETAGASQSYHQYTITVDWKGWKTVGIPLADMSQYNKADWAKVKNMALITGGSWGLVADPRNEFYIDTITADVRGEGEGTNSTSAKTYTTKQIREFKNVAEDAVIVLDYSPNAYYKGKSEVIYPDEYAPVTAIDGGTTLVPANFFEKCLEKPVKSGFINRYGEELDEGEVPYLPLVETAKKLGLNAKTVERVTIVGEDKAIEAVENDRIMWEVAKYLVADVPLDTASITAEDFKAAREKHKKFLVGDENNNIENEYIKKKIQATSKGCKQSWALMNKSADAKVLFGTKECETTADMSAQYSHLANLAYGWGTYGSDYYKNPELLADILFGLEWGYENLYGQDEIDGTGWRSVNDFNWWDWYVKTPASLIYTLTILGDELPQSKVNKYLELFDYLRTIMKNSKSFTDAQSRIFGACQAAVLEQDVELMNECMWDFDILLQFNKTGRGNGVYEDDGTYVNHHAYHYTGTYGFEVLSNRLMRVSTLLNGTKFEPASSDKYNQMFWIKEVFEPCMTNAEVMAMFSGRDQQTGVRQGVGFIGSCLYLIGAFGRDEDMYLKQVIKRHVNENNLQMMINNMSILHGTQLLEILEDDTISHPGPYEETRVYYNGDRAVSHKKDYTVGIAMHSTRLANYESITQQNKNGWYTGDGMVYIYNRNNYKGEEYGKNYWQNANPYLRAGTTVDSQEREEVSVHRTYYSSKDFVGGVDGGEYAAVAMDYEGYHHEGEPDAVVDESGGGFPAFDNDLVAKKSWFLFDDEVVALGAGIKSTKNSEVKTVVENKPLYEQLKISDVVKTDSEVQEYNIAAVTAAGDDGNVPENVIDEKFDTRWSYQATENGWITLELEDVVPVGYIAIAQYSGAAGNPASFALEVSEDGESWKKIGDFESSGKTEGYETYSLNNEKAKYVRYNGKGRKTSMWNSVTEIKIFPPRADGQMLLESQYDSSIIYGSEDITVDGVMLDKEAAINKTYNNPKWVAAENLGGYYFPQGGELTINKAAQLNPFLEMWFSHGANPNGKTYSYVLLPNKFTGEEVGAYAENPDIEVLINTDKIQAVRENKLGITGIIFWEAGTFGGVTASHPMAVMITEKDGKIKVDVSDPSQLLSGGDAASLKIEKKAELISCDKALDVKTEDMIDILINFERSGRTYTAELAEGNAEEETDEKVEEEKPSKGGSTGGFSGGSSGGSSSGNISIITPAPAKIAFNDLDSVEWAKESINALYEMGILSGDGTSKFRPDDLVTREEFAKIIVSAAGINIENAVCNMSDVPENSWFYPYVAAGVQNGIIYGIADGVFGTGNNITRQDMAVLLERAFSQKLKSITASDAKYKDDESISDYAKEAVYKLLNSGVMSGMGDNEFAPGGFVTRAQAAKAVYGLVK